MEIFTYVDLPHHVHGTQHKRVVLAKVHGLLRGECADKLEAFRSLNPQLHRVSVEAFWTCTDWI
jgi:hypothetical protein